MFNVITGMDDPNPLSVASAGFVSDTDTTVADGAGDQGSSAISGLAGLFDVIGTAATQVYRAVNPVTPQQAQAYPGYRYNPATGQYAPVPTVGTTLASNSGLILLVGAGLVAILLLRR